GAPVGLGPGQGAFVDLIGNQVVPQLGQRVEAHPVVVVQPSPAGAPASSCRALVEILDSVSGFSLVLVPGKAVTLRPARLRVARSGVYAGSAPQYRGCSG